MTAEAPSQPEQTSVVKTGMGWYVLRVASNKEDRVRETLERKVAIEGLDDRVGRILVPTVKERRIKGGQVRVTERKLYPGYVFVEMITEEDGSIGEDVWFTIKESSGVGDFIASAGKPIRMAEHEVVAMLAACEKSEEAAELGGMDMKAGDLVKVTEGSFENFEGTVESVDERRGMVTVVLEVFGRSTPVEVEYWMLEKC
ncbi:MAG: transcription termination/antitermination protein NusG [Phycisphaerae bacterium]